MSVTEKSTLESGSANYLTPSKCYTVCIALLYMHVLC